MSRFALAFSLVTALTSSALAGAARAPIVRFAQPPPAEVYGDVAAPTEAPEPDVGVVLDRATVRAQLMRARAANLSRFRAYQQAGTFPSNTYQDRKLNVWLDEGGHFCAAATIIRASGNIALVDRVAEQTNFIRLGDVRQGPLMDWILTSGLTQDEIAAIQEPYFRVGEPSEPSKPPVVDARRRSDEDARLVRRYQQVDAMIVKNQRKSLDLAVDRLMKHQDLAWKLVAGELDQSANRRVRG